MNNTKLLTTQQALDLVEREVGLKITLPTLLTWVKNKDMGGKIGGRWMIYEDKLRQHLKFKVKAVA